MDHSRAPSAPLDDVSAVPLHRLGALLEQSRGDASADAIAARSERFGQSDLEAVERGEVPLADEEVAELLAIYGVDPGQLASARSELVIDLADGTVAAGPTAVGFAPGSDGPDEILARYLALVYEMRGLPAGTPIPLRTLDVSVLSSALALQDVEIEERLEILMAPDDGRVDRWRARLRRRVLVPVVGLVVGVTAAGALILLPGGDPSAGAADRGAATPFAAHDSAVAVALVEGAVVDAVPGPDVTRPLIELAPGDRAAEAVSEPTPPPAVDPEPVPSPPAPEPEVVIGEGLTIERSDVEPVPSPPAPEPEVVIGEGLTIERSDIEP